jgi:hypothetical protein
MVQALMEEIDKFDAEESGNTTSTSTTERLGGFAAHRLPIVTQG